MRSLRNHAYIHRRYVGFPLTFVPPANLKNINQSFYVTASCYVSFSTTYDGTNFTPDSGAPTTCQPFMPQSARRLRPTRFQVASGA